jgi:pimeloyl-ACP methyl ester carboxylesterase
MLVTALVYGLAMLQPIIERLCQEFRVLTFDLRGSGAPDPIPGRGYRVADHAADVAAVIEASGSAPVVGVGSSRGGNVLIRLAVERPDLLRQLVLVGTPLDDAGTAARPDHDPGLATRVQAAVAAGQFETALRLFVPTIIEPGFDDWGEQFIQNCLRMPPGSLRSFVSPDPTLDLAPLLSRVGLPVMVVHGDLDRRVPLSVAHELMARLPEARRHVLHNRGHVAAYTAPGEFCDALRRFIRGGGAPTPEPGGAAVRA